MSALIAYVGHTVPVELILACGARAVPVLADPELAVPFADTYLDDDMEGAVRSMFQRIVAGDYNAADLIVIPRSSNDYLHLYYFLLEVRRMLPSQPFPEVVLLDVLHTPFWSTGQYVYGRVLALKETLERITGQVADHGALSAAIAGANQRRRALQELNALRRLPLPGIAGSAMLRAIAGEEVEPAAADVAPAARLMVKGASHGDTRFYELVEALGAAVVADDHPAGESGIAVLIDEDGDPVEAIARHYQLHVPGVRSFPQAPQDQRFIELVKAAGVTGVIFYHDEFDDCLGWDYPAQKRLLDSIGIPSLYLQAQSYRNPDRAAQAAAVQDLIARSRP
jgi:benzoyl-CoA reductase/2-hydroxyglutaryl-CoA dehydratase subunit BcrC/BadD/HgdB